MAFNIQTSKDWDEYLIHRKKELGKLFDTPDANLESIILNPYLDKKTFCTCRRLGKTYKILAVMLFDLIHIPWYNAACLRKYQGQVQKNLLEPMYDLVYKFVELGIITKAQQHKVIKSYDKIVYENRTIFFLSLENPNNSLGKQPTGGAHGYSAQICTLFIDEIIQAQDKYQLDIETMLANLDTIKGSLNRGIKVPFGSSFQEIWAFNPWDFNNVLYAKEVEKHIPVGSHYISEKKIKQVENNHKTLLKGSGELIHLTEKHAVYRASYLLIPEERFNQQMQDEMQEARENNINKFLCVFAGIHANIFNNHFTYLNNMSKTPEFYDVSKHGELYWIGVGLDRGLRDDTAFSLIAISKNINEYFLIILDTKIFYAEKNQTNLSNVINNLEFLNKWYDEYKPVKKLKLTTDYSSYEFNQYLAEVLNKDVNLRKKYNIFKSVKSTHQGWGIKDRQDFFNQAFAQKKLLFSRKMQEEKIEECWYHFQNCRNNDKGERDERAGVNKLDVINSMEYALGVRNRSIFNL